MNWAMAALLLVATLLSEPASARELRIGVAVETTSIDPHYHNTVPSTSVLRNIYEPLVQLTQLDGRMQLAPCLALAWTRLSDTLWEFRLKPNVRFHDGSSLSAEDVAFSIARPVRMTATLGSFTLYTEHVAEVTAVDATTLRIRTHQPWPQLLMDLSTIMIVPRGIAGHDSTAEFNNGASAIGTGPFRFAGWRKGEQVKLMRNEDYSGSLALWSAVTFHTISADGSRVAALLAHDVDLIDQVPTTMIERLRDDPGFALSRIVSSRLLYLQLDAARASSPFVADASGHVLPVNPLRDRRVRSALSMAINRNALVGQAMDGTGLAAGQLLPDGYFGVSLILLPVPFNPDGARKLLAEAGWPDGFTMTLHGPSNRYTNDRRVGEALGQMLSRVGISTRFEPLPAGIFMARAQEYAFSAILWGWASETAEPSGPLRALLATRDPQRGWGTTNRVAYSNPALDAALQSAMVTMNDASRERLLRLATEIAVHDGGIIPILFQEAIWAMSSEFHYDADALGYTLAAYVTTHPR